MSVFFFLVSPYNPYRKLHLLFGMGFGVQLGDTAVENVVPAHLEKSGKLLVVGAWNIAEEIVFAVVVEYYLHGVWVVRVGNFALKT